MSVSHRAARRPPDVVAQIRHWVAVALMLAAAPAFAAPPEPGSEDEEQLLPYAAWMQKQAAQDGSLCCNVTDCRVVSYRPNASNGFDVFVAEKDDRGHTKFEGGPNAWLTVPDKSWNRNVANPTGRAVACWAKDRQVNNPTTNGFFCFFLPQMT